MNRLEEAPLATLSPSGKHAARGTTLPTWRPLRAAGDLLAPPAEPLPIATFAPAKYEPGYRYPLLVWMHEAASSEAELRVVMPHVSLQNLVAVAPRGDSDPQHDHRFRWTNSAAGVAEAEDAVFEAIDTARERFSVHPDRVFLAGAGAGGAMALRIALRQPGAFAGVASLDGALPRGGQLLGRVNDARRLPLLLASSRGSAGYTQPELCEDLALLHAAGISVDVRQYPGEDSVTTEMLADLHRWVMGQFC
ncbi:MAG: PHB depolymerase family esterase [Planctomycetota bacterium]